MSDERLKSAGVSLDQMLVPTGGVVGKRFLDVGHGSGLSSLAALRLGASEVRSFDYDIDAVAAAEGLRSKFAPTATNWAIEQGSALDETYLRSLGTWDIVCSWGVLHHTGAMWPALGNVTLCVADGGTLFIAIYNDQGWRSQYWRIEKRLYNRNWGTRAATIAFHAPVLFGARVLFRLLTGRLSVARGMSYWHDMLDWLGGYPFEVATPDAVVAFFLERGFALKRLHTVGGRLGCNEFVFSRIRYAS
jgi:SAM-dependent methyltransferase